LVAEDEGKRRVLQLLGLARRAGHAVVGTQAVRDAVRRGEVVAVVVAEDATENARGRLRGLDHDHAPAVVTCGDRRELGRAVGRGEAVVVGIRDRGLGLRIVAGAEAGRQAGDPGTAG
jgi:ribosomal protein L7Ae-like RNA K-turn-binding protein